MRNLEQERAAHALKTARDIGHRIKGKEGGQIVKKIPTMIRENGLLTTGAFACEDRNEGYRIVFDAMINHLGDSASLEDFLEQLTHKDSNHLRQITDECMSYLKYLRRFV